MSKTVLLDISCQLPILVSLQIMFPGPQMFYSFMLKVIDYDELCKKSFKTLSQHLTSVST